MDDDDDDVDDDDDDDDDGMSSLKQNYKFKQASQEIRPGTESKFLEPILQAFFMLTSCDMHLHK